MDWTIPGTALRGSRADVEASIRQIEKSEAKRS